MNYFFNGVQVDYEFKSKNNKVVDVFLHGWGRSKEDFLEIINELKIENYLILDFPPFGKSGLIKDFTIYTYASVVMSLIDNLKIEKFNLIGHSFGGRVAIIIAGKEKERINKLVLIDSAGLKPKLKFSKRIKLLKYKIRKRLKMNVEEYGSSDYRSLSFEMKKVFVSVVNTFLDENAKIIEAQTLIIYGKNDQETPIYMAKKFNKLISNSTLRIIENAGHFCFIERKIKFCEILDKFLRSN